MFIPVDFDVFVGMCENRRSEFCGDKLPDCVFDFYMEKIKKNHGCRNPENNDPAIIIDNIFVNGNWGEIGEYFRVGESIADFKRRITAEGGKIFDDEKIVVGFSPVMFDIIYKR